MSQSTTIFLLVILFNVVSLVLKSRAKKKKAEAEAQAAREAPSLLNPETPVSSKREPPAWASQHDIDEVAQDWDESHGERDVDDYENEIEQENPYRETEAKKAPQNKEKAGSTGKDLFTQLARELGLEIPENRTPPKETKTRTLEPVKLPASVSSKSERSKYVAEDSEEENTRTVADSPRGKDVTSAPGIAAVESANASAYMTRDPMQRTALMELKEELLDSDSLRRAFILKTVLDKPLSLRS